MKLNGLDLFSGIGGLSLALKPWARTICYVEQDRYAAGVLLSKMRENVIDCAPIWDDVRTLRAKHIDWPVDIIYGGFPCQDISVAGNGAGLEGSRSGLFFEIVRLVSEIRPTFVFLENVPAITLRGLDRVLLDLTALGYDCRWTIVSAAEMGAPHLRERWFLLAYAKSERCGEAGEFRCNESSERIAGGSKNVLHSASEGLEGWEKSTKAWAALSECFGAGIGEWPQGLPKPTIRRDDDGFQHRSHRLKCLGNAVVPIQAREAFERLMGLK